MIINRFDQDGPDPFYAVIDNVFLLLDDVVKVRAEFLLHLVDRCGFPVGFIEIVLRSIVWISIGKVKGKESIRTVGERFQFVRLGQSADRVKRNLRNIDIIPKL